MLLLLVTGISVLKTKKIWTHQNGKICHHQREHCALGTDISVCDRPDLLQRNERLSNFSDVANRKTIDILRNNNLPNYILTLTINLTVKGLIILVFIVLWNSELVII